MRRKGGAEYLPQKHTRRGRRAVIRAPTDRLAARFATIDSHPGYIFIHRGQLASITRQRTGAAQRPALIQQGSPPAAAAGAGRPPGQHRSPIPAPHPATTRRNAMNYRSVQANDAAWRKRLPRGRKAVPGRIRVSSELQVEPDRAAASGARPGSGRHSPSRIWRERRHQGWMSAHVSGAVGCRRR
jgi:hypothetical protein